MSRRVVYRTRSPLSGLVKVVDVGADRRLTLDGSVLSIYARDGDWTRARQEYWGEALDMVRLPPRPSVLFVGLGGGTQLHLLRERVTPRHVTAIERDPVIVRLAQRWFGLGEIPRLEFLCAEAERGGGGAPPRAPALRLHHGGLHLRRDGGALDSPRGEPGPSRQPPRRRSSSTATGARTRAQTAAALAPYFAEIHLRRVRREADNILVCASRLRPRARPVRATVAAGSPEDPACSTDRP